MINRSESNNLSISKPCPVSLLRMKKAGNNHFCSTCSKTIIDYRNKSIEEIEKEIQPTTCGIFLLEQLKGQTSFTFLKQLLFNGLTILSFLGFSVRPVNAQTKVAKKDTTVEVIHAKIKDSIAPSPNEIKAMKLQQKIELREAKKRKKRSKKKRKYHVTGCPSF